LKDALKQAFSLKWGDHLLDLDARTHIMGVLNVTPDSFSDGGQYLAWEKAVEHGLDMAREGADIIDIGGESTRPYAERVSANEEKERVIPVIETLSRELEIPISIDSCKSEVTREALRAGASIINDISALRYDADMISVAAEAEVPVILMHMKGTPADMQVNPTYDRLIPEIIDFLRDAMDRAMEGGIRREMIILDPGIGFGKTFDHNLEIIRDLAQFHSLDRPLLIGPSRKTFLGHILEKNAHARDTGTMAAVAAAVLKGAHIVRVHNVKACLDTVKVIDAIMRGSSA